MCAWCVRGCGRKVPLDEADDALPVLPVIEPNAVGLALSVLIEEIWVLVLDLQLGRDVLNTVLGGKPIDHDELVAGID